MDTNDLPLMAQTTYAELLELSGALAFDIAFEEPYVSAKTVKGSKYWYFRPSRLSSGADSPSGMWARDGRALERIAQHRQAKRDQSAQRALVRSLVHSYGLPAPLPAVAQVVEGWPGAACFDCAASWWVPSPTKPMPRCWRAPARCAHADLRCKCGSVLERVDRRTGSDRFHGEGLARD